VAETERSLARISEGDLRRLGELAAGAEEGLFARHPGCAGRYAGRLLCRALCQGAARHFVDGRHGVKDFDVWSLYAARGDGPFPTGGEALPISGRPSSAAGPATRRHTPAAGWTFSAARCPYRPTRTRLRYYATTCHQPGPRQRRHWPTRPSS
jgi:hypothetical protein